MKKEISCCTGVNGIFGIINLEGLWALGGGGGGGGGWGGGKAPASRNYNTISSGTNTNRVS